MSEGKLRMVENSEEVLYTIPVLGSLYLAWTKINYNRLILAKL